MPQPNRIQDPPRGLLNLDLAHSPVQLARFHPSEPLRHLVEHFWSIRWDLRGQAPFTSYSLPYPSVHMVVENGRWRLTGVPTRRFARTVSDLGAVFGIKFRPGGFRPFVGGSVARFTDQTLAAEPVLPLVQQLPADPTEASSSLVERTEAVLLAHLPAPDPRVGEVQSVVQLIAERRDIVRVEQIASAMSVRALQRLFREYVGVSPKWVIQRYRLFEAAELLTAGADGAQVAQSLGYFDQAHFIRDFKALVGRSPHTYALERRVT